MKRLYPTLWMILCCLLFFFSVSYGQADSSLRNTADTFPARWNLNQCLSYAKTNNITINSLRLSEKTGIQNLELSKAAMLPNLYGSVGSDFTHYGKSNTGNPLLSGSMGVSSSWTIYNGGYFKEDIQQKKLSLQSAGLSIEQAQNDISLSIIQYYMNILMDKETIVYTKDLVATDKALVAQMEQQYNTGTAAKKDLIQLNAQLANDQYLLTQSENTEKQDKINLKQLLQLPTELAFDIEKPVADSQPSSSVSSLSSVITDAMQSRPEVRNSELSIDIAKLDLAKALAGYKPTVSLGGAIGTNYANHTGYGLGTQTGNNFYQQVGVTVSIPIFTQKVNKVNKEKAKIAISQAELDLKNTKTVLAQTIEQAYIGTQNNLGAFNASIVQLKYNEEAYRIAGEELKVGSSNTVEYIQQKNLYIQALQSFTNAKYNALLSEKVYEFYRGQPLSIQ